MPELKYIEVTPREAVLAIITIAVLCLMIGALFGAVRSQSQHSTDLASCEARTTMRCMIVAVPVLPPAQDSAGAAP